MDTLWVILGSAAKVMATVESKRTTGRRLDIFRVDSFDLILRVLELSWSSVRLSHSVSTKSNAV